VSLPLTMQWGYRPLAGGKQQVSAVASRATAISAAAAALWAGSIIGVAPAAAHVHAVSPDAVRGSVAVVTFEVPNESRTGSATTELTVTLPDVASARTESKPGWTARLERDTAAGTVRSVTWTAAARRGRTGTAGRHAGPGCRSGAGGGRPCIASPAGTVGRGRAGDCRRATG
jgi:hypothetical protein